MGRTARFTLGFDPVFEEALLNPKLLALLEFVCGKGALLASLAGSVRPQGAPPLFLHADDSNWFTTPLPERAHVVTFCWPTHDLDAEGGATKVAPGSHKLRRNPSAEDVHDEAGVIPANVPKGGFACWVGGTWHGNYPRVAPGERVMLHAAFVRLNLRSPVDWSYLGDVSDKPYALRVMLGLEDRYGKEGPNRPVSREQALTTYEWLKT